MTTYTVSVYAGVPKEGDEPLLSVVIEAEGGAHAIDIAEGKAQVKRLTHSYVEAKPTRRLTP